MFWLLKKGPETLPGCHRNSPNSPPRRGTAGAARTGSAPRAEARPTPTAAAALPFPAEPRRYTKGPAVSRFGPSPPPTPRTRPRPCHPAAPGREGRDGAERPPGAGPDSPGEAGGRCAPAPPWPPRAAPQRGISGYLFLTQHRAPALAWPAAASPAAAARARPARGSAVTRVPAPRGVSPGAARGHGRRASPWQPGGRRADVPPTAVAAAAARRGGGGWGAALICMRSPGWLLPRRATATTGGSLGRYRYWHWPRPAAALRRRAAPRTSPAARSSPRRTGAVGHALPQRTGVWGSGVGIWEEGAHREPHRRIPPAPTPARLHGQAGRRFQRPPPAGLGSPLTVTEV